MPPTASFFSEGCSSFLQLRETEWEKMCEPITKPYREEMRPVGGIYCDLCWYCAWNCQPFIFQNTKMKLSRFKNRSEGKKERMLEVQREKIMLRMIPAHLDLLGHSHRCRDHKFPMA
jgi:hypothetical protein